MQLELKLLLLAAFTRVESQQLVSVNVPSKSDTANDNLNNPESTDEIFVPTNDWQEIKPGQAIPRGLHVRINMQTGKKEAKYLDEKESKEEIKQQQDLEELKSALKGIKNDFTDKKRPDNDGKKSFRTLHELKGELKDFDMKVATDYSVMNELTTSFITSAKDSERTSLVLSLEYYVHQFDNAVDFVTLGGLDKVVLPSLNSSLEDLQESAGFLVGSAAQSNPKVQVAFLEAGLVNILLRIISTNPSPKVVTKALYGLSAILRNFPEAQNVFLRNGGLDTVKQIFKRTGKPFHKTKIRILTLIQDLLDERRHLDAHSDDGQLRLMQYQKVNLEDLLAESGWCQVFQSILILPREDRTARREDVLSAISEAYPLRVEHDSIQKILLAMHGLVKECGQEYNNDKDLRAKLSVLLGEYTELSQREDAEGDLFFSSLVNIIKAILVTTNGKTEL